VLGIGFEDEVVILGPGGQIGAERPPDALAQSVVTTADTGVEHPPAVLGPDHGSGPGGQIVPGAGRSRTERVGQDGPGPQVCRHGVPDPGVAVPKVGSAERPRGFEEEQMDVRTVGGEPEVPGPVVIEHKHGDSFVSVRVARRDRR
jgi:hypothetical protein